MLKNYFTIAINNLFKNKLYSAINIIGLAIGLAACILITLYVQYELSYDRYWEKADHIYRVNLGLASEKGPGNSPAISPLALPALKKFFPDDIELGTRIKMRNGDIQIDNERFAGDISFVDKEFIDIFQVEVIKGSLESTLLSPGNIALSEESAIKYFGDRSPIGEVITFLTREGKNELYKVTAVYRFISPNTVLNVQSFSLLDETKITPIWNYIDHVTYIRLSKTADIRKMADRLPDFVDKNMSVPYLMDWLQPGQKLSEVWSYSLQKLSDIYFDPYNPFLENQSQKRGNKTIITVFIIITLIILIIGCINFVILSTANATQRSREIAMRKVVGAHFKQLLIQFLFESMLLTLIAFLFAVAMTELSMPFFETLVNRELSVPYSKPESYIFTFILLIFVGLLSGVYPALILSRFSPARALKANQTTQISGSFRLRNVLVVFQFTASIALIIATIVTYFQLVYTNKHDPGFNPNKLLIVEAMGNKKLKILQQEILKLPSVINAALSTLQPKLVGGGTDTIIDLHKKTEHVETPLNNSFNCMFVDYNFFNTYELSLISGRYFTRDIDQEEAAPDLSNPQNKKDEITKVKKIIINSAAAIKLGYNSANEAVGDILESEKPDIPGYSLMKIIGVVEDSQYRDLRMKPEPEIYRLVPDFTHFLAVKYKGEYKTALKEVESVWREVVGDIPFRDSNVKQNMAATFLQEEQENKALIAFALLAIFIACMGLFGMAAFTVERRVKEIGLRKVMGAKVRDIVNLLGWNFLKPVLIASIIAWPVAIFAMQSWLERFPYRFHPLFMIPICLVSGLIALAIAWFTVAGNTKRIAKSNPIKALRYE